MVSDMVNYLIDKRGPQLTLDQAALLLIEGRFPVRLIGEHIHNVFRDAENAYRMLTSENAASK